MAAAEVVEETWTTEACADAIDVTVIFEPSDAATVPGASVSVIVAVEPAAIGFSLIVIPAVAPPAAVVTVNVARVYETPIVPVRVALPPTEIDAIVAPVTSNW
jgi:hypothetical protein